ncbi:hypothetical protein [Geitlerinema sp. PCC 7407]|uniref:O-linked N-acetylglucosamine transferase, SPINDLY family protein n=1 Tax=Geitlerinema sp. PCC 7407 TaxID=1173025 RepID=UPI00029FF05D|nr:hypothetical protein [Geitlerinema sp. PCC 7407]AFY68132.1 TPR repeat-containing protein [Geitlerinema sp. PCC 7407]
MSSFHQDSKWKKTAIDYLESRRYLQAAQLYEQAIELNPAADIQNYWWLGLVQLLQGQEADAQATWFCGLSAAEDIDLATLDLINILETEASRQEAKEDIQAAWLIRQHIREIAPNIGRNLLKLIPLSIQQRILTEDSPELEQLTNLLESKTLERVEAQLLLGALESVLDFMPLAGSTLKFAEACIPFIEPSSSFTNTLMMAAMKIAYKQKQPAHASRVAELCLKVEPDNVEVLRILAAFYQNSGQYALGIQTARHCCDLVDKIEDKAFASHLLLRGILSAGGYWNEVQTAIQEHKQILNQLIQEQPLNLHPITVERLFSTTYFLPYCEDSPVENRRLHNEVAKLCQTNTAIYAAEQVAKYQQSQALRLITATSDQELKVGYISHCFNSHSVGWLARWLFRYHNPERIKTYGYFVNFSDAVEDSLRDWYVDNINHVRKMSSNAVEIADQINEDQIDILVDLDSLTLDITCEVMSLKPAPIQVSWLGWDASGIPSIDYFLADPYILPTEAEDYYAEKIWRLPQTFLGIDGFEVAVPTLKREDLGISTDAVIYLSAQTGIKRNPDTVRLQMKVLAQVPNSYLLIKGWADESALQQSFKQIASEEGVDSERLRFLPIVPSEATHRANMGIADVILDTYPYNGATTTMEALWMCVPIVTKVGQQFSARNSYSMMMNAGIQEGIAWSDEEYIRWGVTLGRDAKLRQEISHRLKLSRQTSPLWSGKRFTQSIEEAYQKMWEIYLEGRSPQVQG